MSLWGDLDHFDCGSQVNFNGSGPFGGYHGDHLGGSLSSLLWVYFQVFWFSSFLVGGCKNPSSRFLASPCRLETISSLLGSCRRLLPPRPRRRPRRRQCRPCRQRPRRGLLQLEEEKSAVGLWICFMVPFFLSRVSITTEDHMLFISPCWLLKGSHHCWQTTISRDVSRWR